MLSDGQLVSLTPSVLLGFAVLLLLTGRLIPRVFYKDKMDEAERWRQAYEAERTARGISEAQTDELLEVAKTTHAALVAMAKASERIQQTGHAHAVET
jgi:hypothetical protein